MSQDNVKDLLEEIKNLSELMLDLAYSCIFFQNKEIAEEVMLSFGRFEDLEERLFRRLFAAFRGQAEGSFISVIEIVESAKNVAMAARNLAEMVLEDKELHPVIHAALEETDETIERATMSLRSALLGKSLKELNVGAQIGVAIIGIRRVQGKGHKWIFYPRGDTVLEARDIVIAVGSRASCRKFIRLASNKRKVL